MNQLVEDETIMIKNLIYEIRGKQVMLDRDLARLYRCANGTKTINLAVKRHIRRFPERFMFQLTEEEYENLRFQFETANNMSRSLPYAFTEQGVAMLATILRTEVAEEVSIKIMDAFVLMRKYLSSNLVEQTYIQHQVFQNTENIKLLQESFQAFQKNSKKTEIYFQGQIYDAYSKIQEILEEAKEDIIIIDAYADYTILDMIKRLNRNVTIITRKDNRLTEQDVLKYNQQYHNLNVIYDNTFHDRYFLLDRKVLYHCGASVNRIGYKTFSITLVGDEEVCSLFLHKIDQMISSDS